MAYIKRKRKEPRFKVGDWAVTRKKIKCYDGYFEKGTKVKVIGISAYGYRLEDEYGNWMCDTGFRSIKSIE